MSGRLRWELEMWYILYVSSVHTGLSGCRMGWRLVLLLLHYHENFLVQKLGCGLIPKSNSYIHTYMEYCEYYYLFFYYLLFLSRPLGLLFAVGARVWHAARLGRSEVLGDCGAGPAGMTGRGVLDEAAVMGRRRISTGGVGRTLEVEKFSKMPRVNEQDGYYIYLFTC